MSIESHPEFTRGRLVQAASAVVTLTRALNHTYDVASDIEVERGNCILADLVHEFRSLLSAEVRLLGEPPKAIDEVIELARIVVYVGLGYVPEV